MAREVRVAILGDSKDFSRAVSSANRDAGKLEGAFSKIGGIAKKAAIGLGVVGVGAVAVGKSFVDAAYESQKVTKQTEAVIKSMGGASKVTADQVADLAAKISLKTGVDDELIQSGQNILLTFGNIRNEVGKGNKIFDRATQLATDMSVALGQDMKSSSIQLGKALNDPIKGVTALQRVGVSFTQAQKDQIKALVESGDTLGAQKLILAELDKQFSGSAEAQATAADKLKVAWGNVQEELGAKLIPVIEKVATWLADHLPGAMAATQDFIEDKLIPTFQRIGSAVSEFVGEKLDQLRAWWKEHGPGITNAVKGFAEDFNKYLLQPMSKVASFVADELVPKVASFVTWILENEGVLKAFGTLIGVTLVGHYVKLGVEATISAGKQVAAWVTTKAEAIASAATHAVQIAAMIGKWALLATKAAAHAATVVASWLATKVAAIAATVSHGVQVALQSAGWRSLSSVAATQSASIAASWGRTLGAAGAVIAAAETINNLTGNKLNPNGLSLWERLDPRKAFKGLSFGLPEFAQGGVVPGAIGQPQLVLAHGGEEILTRGRQMRSGGGDTIVVPVSIGGEEIDRIVIDVDSRTARRGFAA